MQRMRHHRSQFEVILPASQCGQRFIVAILNLACQKRGFSLRLAPLQW